MIKQYKQTVASARRKLERAAAYAENAGDVSTSERLKIITSRLKKEEERTGFKPMN